MRVSETFSRFNLVKTFQNLYPDLTFRSSLKMTRDLIGEKYTAFGVIGRKRHMASRFKIYGPAKQFLCPPLIYSPVELNDVNMYNSLVKYFQIRKPNMNFDALKNALNYSKRFWNITPHRVLTPIEAYNCIWDQKTSPGMPWRRDFRYKRDMGEELIVQLCNDYDQRARKNNTAFFWHINPKDELRKNPRKVRTIIGIPVDVHVNMLRYSEGFNSQITENNNSTFIGKNPMTNDWNELIYPIYDNGGKVFQIDGHAWDSTISNEYQRLISSWRAEMCGDSTIKNIYRECMQSVFWLWNNDVVVKEYGLCTGYTNTLIDNTIYNLLTIMYIFIRKFPLCSYESIMAKTKFAIMGDDILLSTKLNIQCSDFEDIGKEVGIDYEVYEIDFFEAQMMQSKMVMREGRFIYYPNEDRVLDSCCYYKSQQFDSVKYIARLSGLRLISYYNASLESKIFDLMQMVLNQIDDDEERRLADSLILSKDKLDKLREVLTPEAWNVLHEFGYF